MEPPLLTLVADAYPLIWLVASSATVFPGVGICHPVLPGLAFSSTTGLEPVAARARGGASTTASRNTTVATTAARQPGRNVTGVCVRLPAWLQPRSGLA